jgi:hypothetical protein
MSTRDYPGGEGGRCVRLTTYNPCSAERQEIRGLNLPGTPVGLLGLSVGVTMFYTTTCFGFVRGPSSGYSSYKAETCSCILHSVLYYRVILSDILFVVFWLHVYESIYTFYAVLIYLTQRGWHNLSTSFINRLQESLWFSWMEVV